jgi:hypothetical protein
VLPVTDDVRLAGAPGALVAALASERTVGRAQPAAKTPPAAHRHVVKIGTAGTAGAELLFGPCPSVDILLGWAGARPASQPERARTYANAAKETPNDLCMDT